MAKNQIISNSSSENNSQFLVMPPFVQSSIRWTPRAKISVTPWTIAQSVAKRCKTIFPTADYIIDTTSCFGNEAMAFRLEYDEDQCQVEACEWDLTHMMQLKDSIRQCPGKGISLTSKSSAKRLYEIDKDILPRTIVVCDPCWGGSDYKKQKVIRTLFLGDKDIKDLIIDIPAALWVLKLPVNFDQKNLLADLASNEINVQHYVHTIVRPNGSIGMVHLILKRSCTDAKHSGTTLQEGFVQQTNQDSAT